MDPVTVTVTPGDEYPISVDVTNTPGADVGVTVTSPTETPIDLTVSETSPTVVDVTVTENAVGPVTVDVTDSTPGDVTVNVTEIVPAPIVVNVEAHDGGPKGDTGPMPPNYAVEQAAQDADILSNTNQISTNSGLISANSGLIAALQAAELLAVLTDGSRAMTGQLSVNPSGIPPVEMGLSYGTTYGGIKGDAGYLILTANGTPSANGSLYLRTNGTGSVNIGGAHDNMLSVGNGTMSINGTASMTGRFTISDWVDANGFDADAGSQTAPVYSFTADANTGIYHVASDSIALTAGGSWRAWFEGDNVRMKGIWVTASSAGFYTRVIDTNGRMAYFSSSIRVKKDVEDMELTRAKDIIKRSRPVWFRSKNTVDRDDHSFYGLIAEEVAQIDPRFVQMKPADDCACVLPTEWEVNDDPDDHTVDLPPNWLDYHTCDVHAGGVDYPALVAPLLAVVKEQEERLDAQDILISDLISRLEALETKVPNQ